MCCMFVLCELFVSIDCCMKVKSVDCSGKLYAEVRLGLSRISVS